MDFQAQDAYEQFSDASTTPLWDLAIGLMTVATVLGGGLAAIYAAGYLAVGRASLAWPLLATAAALITANLALRRGRAAARRPRSPAPWRRRRLEDPAPSASDSHDERLKSIRPMHFEPDDEGHTREDKARERKYREADRQPPFFG